ncbi:Hypothetical protein F387_02044 [Wohlfahrtiimonas chitiniclastica SH04]|uniref:Uncharacterized protein n=2 Tax=Wohlfahrtiimonas chitiniclastica TaxID=400946 RepID=L8XTD3_9GAMM|nr:Hypothetical protein F387_02044 [Wohlfahrtiimonas chitiniclastica SH04]
MDKQNAIRIVDTLEQRIAVLDDPRVSGKALKGNFGIGEASSLNADLMGKSWVGDGYKVASDGKTLVSSDGMRQYI